MDKTIYLIVFNRTATCGHGESHTDDVLIRKDPYGMTGDYHPAFSSMSEANDYMRTQGIGTCYSLRAIHLR
jgi:hypothetical protein